MPQVTQIPCLCGAESLRTVVVVLILEMGLKTVGDPVTRETSQLVRGRVVWGWGGGWSLSPKQCPPLLLPLRKP